MDVVINTKRWRLAFSSGPESDDTDTDVEFVYNTGGDFDVVPTGETDYDDDEPEGFGFQVKRNG